MKKFKINRRIFQKLPLAKQLKLRDGGFKWAVKNMYISPVDDKCTADDYDLLDLEIGYAYSIKNLNGLIYVQRKCTELKKATGMVFSVSEKLGIVYRVA